MGKLIDSLIYSLKKVTPFFIIIFLTFLVFGMLGIEIFGGRISSKTLEIYTADTGSTLEPGIINLNMNDLGGTIFTFLQINTDNCITNISTLLTAGNGMEHNNWEILFFISFMVLNNIVYFNIFIGLVTGIGLEYATELLEAVKSEQKTSRKVQVVRGLGRVSRHYMYCSSSSEESSDDESGSKE